MTGWFESLTLRQGNAQAQTVVLVSLFASRGDAQHAYAAILPHGADLHSLPIGDAAEEWPTNSGVASGPRGLAGYFGGFTTFGRSAIAVFEVRADVSGRLGTVLTPPLPNPGRAIIRTVSRIARS